MNTSCRYGNRVSLLLVKKVKVNASTQTDEIKKRSFRNIKIHLCYLSLLISTLSYFCFYNI